MEGLGVSLNSFKTRIELSDRVSGVLCHFNTESAPKSEGWDPKILSWDRV
jgi:hypothetical protein